MPFTKSADGTEIHFEKSGSGKPTLLFAHGWLGNASWWHAQREHFEKTHQVVLMDLGGHGKSGMGRKTWSVKNYAEDMTAVIKAAELSEVVLVGHSMSGAYAMEAFSLCPKEIKGIVLVDTLLNLEQLTSMKEMAPFLAAMRENYAGVVESELPKWLFAETSPRPVVTRILGEFLKASGEQALERLQPLYETDIRPACLKVRVPVRAINADKNPTNVEGNRKYLADYDAVVVNGVGHYPMLEAPAEFNAALEGILASFS